MRRLCLLVLLAALAVPGLASAASWHPFASRQLGFSMRYPANWQLVRSDQPGIKQVLLSHQSRQLYSVTIALLPIKAASPAQTVAGFMRFERRQGNTGFARIRWSKASIGGKHGAFSVISPPTEGGVSLSQGIYLLPWRSHVYEIALSAVSKHALSRPSQFPRIYQQILASWRFL